MKDNAYVKGHKEDDLNDSYYIKPKHMVSDLI